MSKATAETYAQRIWDDKDLRAVDDLVHPKIIVHSLLGDFHGTDPLKKVIQVWLEGFPDLVVKNKTVICEGERVVIEWHAKGTHRGEFKGIKPTGKQVSYTGVTLYRVEDGKITEYAAYLDMQYLLQQIKP